jgi:hypothetical protein
MGGRVRGGDHAAVRVAEEEHSLQPEVSSQLVEVGDVVGGLVRAGVGGAVGPSLPRGLSMTSVNAEPRPARSPK